MSKCTMCHVNEAVIFTTRLGGSGSTPMSEGLCLKCAYDTGLGGMAELFKRAGINDDNIDDLQRRVNNMMRHMQGRDPAELFKMFLNQDPEAFAAFGESLTDDIGDVELPFELGEEAAPTAIAFSFSSGDNSDESPLLPAAIGEGDELSEIKRRQDREQTRRNRNADRSRKRKFLDQYGTNLTQEALAGRVDRIIGREKELARVIQILNRRNKNNPALLGEPGVGKTAIAEGLAVRIAEGRVPAKLLDQQVYLLDMTAMVAGTQFRGQFENRMKGVVEDARNSGDVILVIDELHNIMGAGDAEGAMNAANILKPALAKGEIRVIGSTTLDEYRRFIEKDSALERRFQKVIVEEPSIEDSIKILCGIRDYYEQHHHVTYSDEVLEAAVRLSQRYITERFCRIGN